MGGMCRAGATGAPAGRPGTGGRRTGRYGSAELSSAAVPDLEPSLSLLPESPLPESSPSLSVAAPVASMSRLPPPTSLSLLLVSPLSSIRPRSGPLKPDVPDSSERVAQLRRRSLPLITKHCHGATRVR